LLHIALPASAQGFFNGLFNLLDVSLIGYLVGTQEACVFVLVATLTWLPTTLTYGLFEALAKLIPYTMDHCNPKLAGFFLSMAMVFFTFTMASIGLFWTFTMKMTWLRFGFDDNAALLAEQYVYVQITLDWISGLVIVFIYFWMSLVMNATVRVRISFLGWARPQLLSFKLCLERKVSYMSGYVELCLPLCMFWEPLSWPVGGAG
jgi:Na+-driven multidrug efflux pump